MKHKSCEIELNPQYDRYLRRLASMVYKSFDQKIGSGVIANVNEELAQKLHKTMIKKFSNKKRKIRKREM